MFCKIINKIKVNCLIKKKYIITKLNKNEIFLIKKLIKLNIIKLLIKNNNKFLIVLNFLKKEKLIFKIKNMYKKSNLKNMKLKNIKNINFDKKIIILSTNKGLLDNNESSNNKTGGTVIMYL